MWWLLGEEILPKLCVAIGPSAHECHSGTNIYLLVNHALCKENRERERSLFIV